MQHECRSLQCHRVARYQLVLVTKNRDKRWNGEFCVRHTARVVLLKAKDLWGTEMITIRRL